MTRRIFPLIVLFVILFPTASPLHAIECVFTNPLIDNAADPSVIYHEGMYYWVSSATPSIYVAAADTITGLAAAEAITVFTPPADSPYRYDIWAPELYYHEDTDEWYIYFAATDAPGANPTHRIYAIRALSDDPQGAWEFAGKVYDPANDFWAIDAAVFEYEDQLYMVWSGWPTTVGDFPQNLYIASMSDPLTLSSERILISEPDQAWETSVAAIQEGPQPFIHNGELSLVYSGNASWSADYALGVLHLTGDDPLDRASWTKIGPVFDRLDSPQGNVYGPGHNASPVLSPDGTESWLLYHSIETEFGGWAAREIRAQEFTWDESGIPVFGDPIPAGVPMDVPSGEPCGLIAYGTAFEGAAATPAAPEEITVSGTPIELGSGLINTLGSFSVSAWVRLESTEQPMSILTQEGGLSSHFALEYVDGAFAFTQFEALGGGFARAAGGDLPEAGEWVHLVGVRDLGDQEVRLYINGELAADAVSAIKWESQGATLIGALRQRGQRTALFSGTVFDVQLYAGALDEQEVEILYLQHRDRFAS